MTGVVLGVTVVGLAAAASPGRLTVSDPGWWLLGVLVLVALAVLGTAAVVLLLRHPRAPGRRRQSHVRETEALPGLLLLAVVIAAMVWGLNRLRDSVKLKPLPAAGGGPPPPPPAIIRGAKGGRDLGPWIVVLVAVVVLAGLVWVVVAELRRRRRSAPPVELLPAGDPLAAAVEAALLDLEGETDPRRAVIKAYARTESVLREHGLPRRPSEAPLEYLDRVLRELGARAGAVDRLTELFERAAFSQHEVGQDMRHEAIAVFHELRHELAIEIIDRSEPVER